VANNNTLLQKR